ncbi:unnamed protein product [Amoebophrya sp. A120]|nr:unnamed protein product [Amoebophrya sp. A120]|eukprot:GSA120T00006152001.1
MPEDRVYNFSAGPCILPVEVLEECKGDMLNFKKSGMGVMEMSHRSKDFVNIYNETEKNLRDVLAIPDHYKVLFAQGGASLQFASVPLNFFGGGKTNGDYAVTGQWGEKAVKECGKYGTGTAVCNTKPQKFTHIPPVAEWKMSDPETTAFLHYTDNETVNGVEFTAPPEIGTGVPLVADMSSNFCTRPIDVGKHAMIYAGAQKNAGIAGNTICMVDEKYMSQEMKICPSVCSWKTQAGADGMYNTPPCYAIYVTGVYLKYTKEKGGVSFWAEQCAKKSGMIYDVIDGSSDYYTCPVQKDSRSRCNLPFQIGGGNDALEKKFLEEAKKINLYTLAGHRTVGGIRASLYNGMPMKGVETLQDFMKSFMEENPL